MKLIRSVRATEPPDPWSGPKFTSVDMKLIEAIADHDDVVDLALAVAEKRLDPAQAVAACKRVADYRKDMQR